LATKLWKARTASSTQKMPLTSRHRAEPLLSSVLAGGAAGSSVLASGIVSFSLLLQLAGGQDDEGLRPRMIVGHSQVNVDCVAVRRKGLELRFRAIGYLYRRRP
jgi:hypothetical protein